MKTFLVFLIFGIFFVNISSPNPTYGDIGQDDNENLINLNFDSGESFEIDQNSNKTLDFLKLIEDHFYNQIGQNSNEVRANMLTRSALFEGDIILTPEQKNSLDLKRTGASRILTETTDEKQRWPKGTKGDIIVPYTIAIDDYSSDQIDLIEHAMNEINSFTCAKFKKRSTEDDYLDIRSGDGCASYVGRIGGRQKLSLQKNSCMEKGIIMHELVHALGLGNMHSHIDRDKFVEIKWDNIEQNATHHFNKVDPQLFGNFRTEYDIHSIMHYPKDAFSKNGELTIVPRNNTTGKLMGQRIQLSVGDIERINDMYKCDLENDIARIAIAYLTLMIV